MKYTHIYFLDENHVCMYTYLKYQHRVNLIVNIAKCKASVATIL